MKVLVVSMRYDYGIRARGLSGNQYYFDEPISRVVDSVVSFDFMTLFNELGRARMNQELLETVRREQPDVTLLMPYTNQFDPGIIHEINRYTVTIGYLFDDPWRVAYSRFWAQHFTFITTSDVNGVRRFGEAGIHNVIYSPFGCNTQIYRKLDLSKIYDVSFVGQYHPYRAWCFRQLQKAGLRVHAWGQGWPAGRIDFEPMIAVFNQSKINLNMSNCVSWDLRYLASSWRALKDTLRSTCRRDPKTSEMVKARHFEINACGGFQLSYYAEGLERAYRIGEEIAIYATPGEMAEKIQYYLKHEDEREAIAQRGHERALAEHRLEDRYRHLFAEALRRRPVPQRDDA
jgi:spore maturation protein CgeB